MILVTGASGFVGGHLLSFLSEKGHTVRALYYNNVPSEELRNLTGVSWMKCDLLDVYDVAEAIKGITHIYHLAGKVSFMPGDREKVLHINMEATANIVNAALEEGIDKLVFISSIAALGRGTHSKAISEDDEWEESKYNSTYACSKYLAEMEVWRGIAEGLNAVIINPGIILGEGNWNEGSARLMKIADSEFPFYTEGINGWVDVKDVIKAMYMLMQSPVDSERYILCEGSYPYKKIFVEMARTLGRKPPYIKANALLTGILWRWNELRYRLTGKTVTVTKETARTAQMKYLYNNEKLLKAFPEFQYTPLEETIKRMAGDYKKVLPS